MEKQSVKFESVAILGSLGFSSFQNYNRNLKFPRCYNDRMVVTDLKDRVLNGRYKLLHSLGQGGMALVFEAYDQLLERPVAIKLLRKDFSGIPGFRERFLQEARAAANLSHPNIVAVYDFGIDSGEIYIVMELANGLDLKSAIQAGGSFTVSHGLDIGIQICAGLGYAHRAGIIHCDVKPQNIILTKDRIAKITDFGIARAMSETSAPESADFVWGSPQYMAPELIGGATPTTQSDVYSIGSVLYEIFTGNPPFEGDSVDEILDHQKNSQPLSIRNSVEEFPDELDEVILKVLSKEPSQRYRTADQLGSVLSLVRHKSGILFEANNLNAIPTLPTTPPPLPLISYEDAPHIKDSSANIDWSLIGIELLCLLMAGGLIPFWLFVIYSVQPLMR